MSAKTLLVDLEQKVGDFFPQRFAVQSYFRKYFELVYKKCGCGIFNYHYTLACTFVGVKILRNWSASEDRLRRGQRVSKI
jgi:hypothetical protein